jgi:hypothetical protein
MYIILEYLALLALVAMAAAVTFGVASLILVIREGAKWLAVSSRRLFRQESGLFFSRRRSRPKPEAAFSLVRPTPRKQFLTLDSELNAAVKGTR